jgi:ribonuclease HI
MLVTVIADASFAVRSKYQSSGWAAYVVRDNVRRYYGGSFHMQMVSNITAECGAIVNGVWSALEANHICEGDRLIIQTDCMAAIELLPKGYGSISGSHKKRPHMKQINEMHFEFARLMLVNGLKYEFRHVRGHTNDTASRSFVQGQCDRLARRHMAIQDNERRKADGG